MPLRVFPLCPTVPGVLQPCEQDHHQRPVRGDGEGAAGVREGLVRHGLWGGRMLGAAQASLALVRHVRALARRLH